jgi:hypothetical protein
LPAAAGSALRRQVYVANVDKRPGRCQTLLELQYTASLAYRPFHLLFGTRCRTLPLSTRGRSWPRTVGAVLPADLGLIGSTREIPGTPGGGEPVRLTALRRLMIAGHAGLLLRVKAYPEGGVHGGHVVALWNAAGRGYVVSVHFEDNDRPGQNVGMEEATTLAIAAEATPRP